MEPEDPEDRIAELERQLGEAKADARRQHTGAGDPAPFPQSFDSYAQQDYSPDGSDGTPLSAAPRKVPASFLLAELLPFRWWYLFAMFMVAIPPIIVWITQPIFFLPTALLVIVVIYGFQFRSTRTRLALLKWGQAATVTGSELVSQGTYYGGTTYSNVMLPVANGWKVTRPLWSGPSSKTRIRYQLDGYQGDITVRGREYIDGVVLADQRSPQRARCVTYFPYDLDRDDTGNWVGQLRVRLVIGMLCWLLIVTGWLVGAWMLYRAAENFNATNQSAASTPTFTPSTPTHRTPTIPGQPGGQAVFTVNGADQSRTIECNGADDVTVNGTTNRVGITGHCASLTVSGSNNKVSVDVADTITVNGIDNLITYRVGEPAVTNGGIDNVVQPGS